MCRACEGLNDTFSLLPITKDFHLSSLGNYLDNIMVFIISVKKSISERSRCTQNVLLLASITPKKLVIS